MGKKRQLILTKLISKQDDKQPETSQPPNREPTRGYICGCRVRPTYDHFLCGEHLAIRQNT